MDFQPHPTEQNRQIQRLDIFLRQKLINFLPPCLWWIIFIAVAFDLALIVITQLKWKRTRTVVAKSNQSLCIVHMHTIIRAANIVNVMCGDKECIRCNKMNSYFQILRPETNRRRILICMRLSIASKQQNETIFTAVESNETNYSLIKALNLWVEIRWKIAFPFRFFQSNLSIGFAEWCTVIASDVVVWMPWVLIGRIVE